MALTVIFFHCTGKVTYFCCIVWLLFERQSNGYYNHFWRQNKISVNQMPKSDLDFALKNEHAACVNAKLLTTQYKQSVNVRLGPQN